MGCREFLSVGVNNGASTGHFSVRVLNCGWGFIAVAGSGGPKASDSDPIADLHHELAETLRRIAWAMLRDRALADDAVQDAFLLLSVKIDEVPQEHRRVWLIRTVQFVALNLRRTRQRQGRLLREQAEQYQQALPPADGAQSTALMSHDDLELLRRAMLELPEDQRQVLRRRLYDEKTFQEIATELGITLGTALSRMRLAIEKLRKSLT